MHGCCGRHHTVDQKLRYLFINLTLTCKYGHNRQPNCLPSIYGRLGILALFRMTLLATKMPQVVGGVPCLVWCTDVVCSCHSVAAPVDVWRFLHIDTLNCQQFIIHPYKIFFYFAIIFRTFFVQMVFLSGSSSIIRENQNHTTKPTFIKISILGFKK